MHFLLHPATSMTLPARLTTIHANRLHPYLRNSSHSQTASSSTSGEFGKGSRSVEPSCSWLAADRMGCQSAAERDATAVGHRKVTTARTDPTLLLLRPSCAAESAARAAASTTTKMPFRSAAVVEASRTDSATRASCFGGTGSAACPSFAGAAAWYRRKRPSSEAAASCRTRLSSAAA